MTAISGVVVTGPVVPTDTSDTFPTHKSQYGLGGWMEVANEAARLAIPSDRREAGMHVYQIDTKKYWTLQGGIADGNWALRPLGGAPVLPIWSAEQAVMEITATPGNVAGPSVVVPSGFLPAGATINRVELVMKYRKAFDTSGSDNKIAGPLNVQVKESVSGSFTTGIVIADDSIEVAADGESGGDLLVGSIDVKAEVAADNKTYAVQIASAAADGASLELQDVQFGLRFFLLI
jgi:hypothetical protein